MFAAQPWDWWIAMVLFAVGLIAIVAIIVGYLYKVVSPQYPKRGQRRQQIEQKS